MKTKQFRELLYEEICESSKIQWVSMNYDLGNEQNILLELKDGTKFQIFIIETDRSI